MAPARGSAELPNATLNMLFEKMGEVQAGVREAKHAANGASQKIDSVAGKVDALALVVATQGEIRNHVERLETTVKEQGEEIETLVADKHRREGAIGLVEWISKHWPFTLVALLLGAIVVWANGKLHL
jgi:seryl-tRNA synthetase